MEARSAGLGKGSEFIVSLPRSVMIKSLPTRRSGTKNGEALPDARRVLIADDNTDAAESLGMYLQLRGHETFVAHSGTEAFEIAARCRPEIGIFDIGMPDLNGYAVAERIRREAWGGSMTLIAVTGWGQDNDKRRAHAAGFDHHLTKPVDPEHLAQLFEDDKRVNN